MSEDNVEERKISEDSEREIGQGKKIVFRVDKDEIAKQVREELKQEEKLDENIKHFETLKIIAIEQAPVYEDQINNCGSPAEVMEILESARSERKTEKKHPPYGKSTFLPPSDSSKFGSQSELIDSLYETAFYNPKATQEEKADARAKINELWKSFTFGKAHNQLRESPSNMEKIMKPMSDCPNCFRSISPPLSRSNPVCDYCGYDVREKNDGRKGTSIRAHEWTSSGEPPK